MIYILSCTDVKNGGGIYSFSLSEKEMKQTGYLPCDRPMYSVMSDNRICTLLRAPFEENLDSGYFFCDEKLENSTPIISTKGVVACHLDVVKNNVYTVNYLSGNVVKNGEIEHKREGKSIHPTRQSEPHTHFIKRTYDGYFAVCDLGTDTLAFYDKNLNLYSEEKVPLGYGIRHLAYSLDNKFIYSINELIPSISVFSYDKGKAKLLSTFNIKVTNEKANGAGIRISKDGKFLYVSLREENVICVFLVNNDKLELLQTVDCKGNSPRDFNIFNNFLVCTNELSNSVTVFSLENGLIKEFLYSYNINSPLCVF